MSLESNPSVLVDPQRVGARIKALSRQRRELALANEALKASLAERPTVDDYQALKREVTSAKHAKAFESAARAANIASDRIADAFTLSGLSIADGEPDAAKIAAALGRTIEGRPWLLAPPSSTPTSTVDAGASGGVLGGDFTAPAIGVAGGLQVADGGVSRGVPDRSTGGLRFSRAQLKNPEFMRQNQARIADAVKAGTFFASDR